MHNDNLKVIFESGKTTRIRGQFDSSLLKNQAEFPNPLFLKEFLH